LASSGYHCHTAIEDWQLLEPLINKHEMNMKNALKTVGGVAGAKLKNRFKNAPNRI